jgi:hypothetical protein
VMADLGRPAFIQDEVKPWRTLAARVIHLGDRCGGLGLGSTLPTERAARGGGHAGVRAFQALRRPKRYGIRCNMTREERGSSPRAWIGRGGAEGGRP